MAVLRNGELHPVGDCCLCIVVVVAPLKIIGKVSMLVCFGVVVFQNDGRG